MSHVGHELQNGDATTLVGTDCERYPQRLHKLLPAPDHYRDCMEHPSLTIRDADDERIDRIEAVLEANSLPHQDVREKSDCFFTAHSGAEFVGTGGVETYGSDGLLRSLVITESNRGHGFGATLCAALEDYARTCGVDRLYLLTSTAEAFFSQRGYETTARDDAPARIQQTTEFTDLCSNSATCMRKTL